MRAPDPVPTDYATRRAAERRLQPRLFRYAIALSAGLHFVALYFLNMHVPVKHVTPDPPPRVVRIVPEMQALELDLVDIEAPSIDVQIRRAPEAPPSVAAPTVSAPIAPAGPPAAPRPSVAGDPSLNRLRYQNSEKDVWRRSDVPARSAEEMMRERVAAQFDAYNDSVAAEANARERALDWTVKGEDGKRWGVSPGAIHLGDITVPLPFAFAPGPEKREEVAGRLTTWGAIQQQATIVEGREIIKDRVKAMEQRKAAERAARQGTSGGGSGGGS